MENYSSGAAGGYAFTKPFNISDGWAQMSYIGSDGYLYTGGYCWGGSTSSGTTTFYKQTNAGTNIVDHELSYQYGIIVNSSGEVKVGAQNTSTSATWSTVSVGGSVTGSSNKAVAVSISRNYQFVLMADGRLYVSNGGATSMTSLVFSAATSSSRGGIKDILLTKYDSSAQYVLFGNGDLYGSTHGNTSMTRIATGVKMMDSDYNDFGRFILIYDGSMIKYSYANGSSTHTWENLLSSNRTDVVQIRGGGDSGWGYLTSDGTLYGNYSSGRPTANATQRATGVSYFDNSHDTWGYLKDGKIYLWDSNSEGSRITTNTVPSTSGLPSTASGLPTPDLGGFPAISSSPPAMNFPKKKLIIN